MEMVSEWIVVASASGSSSSRTGWNGVFQGCSVSVSNSESEMIEARRWPVGGPDQIDEAVVGMDRAVEVVERR